MLVAVLATVVPGVAHAAAPPANDDFDDAAVVTSLPFTAQEDSGAATKAADDPGWCSGYAAAGTVWFRYTATQDGLLRATTAGSDHRTLLSANTGLRGGLQNVADACDYGTGPAITFRATAGTTYSFLVAGLDTPGGALSFALDTVASAPNDTYADAQPVTTLPFTGQPDLSVAAAEAGEPESTCVDDEGRPSVWYSYSAGAAQALSARVQGTDAAVTVYSGGSPAALTQVACARDNSSRPALFRTEPGTVYAIRVTGAHHGYGPFRFTLQETPPLEPDVSVYPSSATVFDNVGFSASSWEQIDLPLGGTWDFGDGTSAPVGTETVYHRYAADGVYSATLHATSPDGRTATVTRSVTVTTHDVGISKFTVPSSARQGESKPINVDVTNTRYAETVTVVLSKRSTNWAEVGRLTLQVPARATGKVRFPFAYTFTPDDAAAGKVAFRAEVQLAYPSTDALPGDNEAISVATTVKPPATRIAAV
ncbi:PKD domain-containing protein [Amycolatopsis kentuckyensis]|uniref:PKD domain-containing protein n=1 Tax=Amycolatopsis kentuckyensis TaxID=218823 RepID=UPI0011786816|nr:PKD domain-containing protein [Amycolatopsis kentuckyensis]